MRIFTMTVLVLVMMFSSVSAEEQSTGENLYEQKCALCHEGGAPKAPHRDMLMLLTPERIFSSMVDGVMKDQSAGLTDDQKMAIAEYISMTKAGQNIQPKQCSAADRVVKVTGSPFQDWGLTRDNSHHINKSIAGFDVSGLQDMELKWAFAYPNSNRARSQPVVAGDTLYVGSHPGLVYALDKHSGCVKWSFQAQGEVRTAISHFMEGGQSYLHFGDLIGHVYVISATDGSLVWRRKVDDHPNATITAAPAYHGGTLFIPVSSLEVTSAANPTYECCTFRGKVLAVEALTGKEKWIGYTVAEEPRPLGTTSAGTRIIGPSGAPIWAGLLLDPSRNLVIAGTGENYSSPATGESDSIIAYDMTTGKKRWLFQATEGDAWNVACMMPDRTNCPEEDGPDFDFGAGPLLYRDASGQDLVIAGQKSGVVHGINADTGAVVWQTRLGRGGIQGGIHFGMALIGDTVFVPMSDFDDEVDRPHDRMPGISAVDAKTGKVKWQVVNPNICEGRDFCSPGISAAISAIDGAVLAGAMDGVMRAYDPETGKVLWSYDTTKPVSSTSGTQAKGGSMGGASAPVAIGGMLFFNSGYGIYGHMPGNVLLAFGPKK